MWLTKFLLKFAFVGGCLLMSLPSNADQLPELTGFLREQIKTAHQSLREKPVGSTILTENYVLRNWYLRLRAIVGIDVPWIASFQIVPEVELMFERSK